MDSVIDNFAREKVLETPGEELLGDKILDYEQIHLAIPSTGDNYREKSEQGIARLAIINDCELAVDADFCCDDPKNRSVILAATGLKKKIQSERHIEGSFDLRRIISHISTQEFLRRLGENPEDYSEISLMAEYSSIGPKRYLSGAEIELAKEAVMNGCIFVTEIDYVQHEPLRNYLKIEAKGLKRK